MDMRERLLKVKDFVSACPDPVVNREDIGSVWCRGYTFTYFGIEDMTKEVEQRVLQILWTSAQSEFTKG